MSYILDALRKSEHERSLGAVPDLETIQQERPVTHASRWPWLVGVLLLLNVAIGIAFLLKEPATVVVAESGRTGKTEPAVSLVPAVEPEGGMAPADIPEPARAGVAANESLLPSSIRELEPPPTSLAKVETLDIQPPVDLAAPAQSLPEISSSEMAAPGPAAATDWVDMPADFRSRVSRPDIDVHVYSDEPARRFVLIDLQKYREGERIDSGLEIESITQYGVIFSDRGTLFQVTRP